MSVKIGAGGSVKCVRFADIVDKLKNSDVIQSPFYRWFKSHYWHNMPATATVINLASLTSPLNCISDDQQERQYSHIVDVLSVALTTDDSGRQQVKLASRILGDKVNQVTIVIFSNGVIATVDISYVNEPVVKSRSTVTLPRSVKLDESKTGSGQLHILSHAAIDPATLQLYFTLTDDRIGILTASLIDCLRKTHVELDFFVHGSASGQGPISGIRRHYEGIAIDTNAEVLFCCDSTKHRVIRQFSLINGRELAEISPPPVLIKQFCPFKIAITQKLSHINPYRYLAVADWLNSQVLIFTIAGEEIKFSHVIAGYGSQLGKVNGPRNVAFDPAGNLLVADTGNRRVQMFCRKTASAPVPTTLLSQSRQGPEMKPPSVEAEQQQQQQQLLAMIKPVDDVIVWHFDVGARTVPSGIALQLTTDAYPRPIIVIATNETLPPDESGKLPKLLKLIIFTCENRPKIITPNNEQEDQEQAQEQEQQ